MRELLVVLSLSTKFKPSAYEHIRFTPDFVMRRLHEPLMPNPAEKVFSIVKRKAKAAFAQLYSIRVIEGFAEFGKQGVLSRLFFREQQFEPFVSKGREPSRWHMVGAFRTKSRRAIHAPPPVVLGTCISCKSGLAMRIKMS